MIFQSLSLENFRQFYGVQHIEFAQGSDGKNVTLVHGFNGAGKTTLLNAFVWCLYGKTTADFGAPERLTSERALFETAVGSRARAQVRLRFQVRGDEYLVERSVTTTRAGTNDFRQDQPELRLYQIVGGDMVTPGGNEGLWQDRIHQMLPVGLYPFFFFNGERVEWLARAEASKEVERGIKTLLDVEIYERGLRHLRDQVSHDLAAELRTLGNTEVREAIDLETRIVAEEQDYLRRRDETEKNLAAVRDTIEALERRQAAIQQLSDLTQKRDLFRKELDEKTRMSAQLDGDLAALLSSDGYLAMAEDVFLETRRLVQGARERGELPAKIKPQFVNDLLERQLCICGRTLDPSRDRKEVALLEEWMGDSGLAALDEAISAVSGAIPGLEDRRGRFAREVDQLLARRDDLLRSRSELNDQLAHVEAQMGDRKLGEDVVTLKRQLDGERQQEVQLRADLKHLQDKLVDVEARLREVRKRISDLNVQGEKAGLVKRQKAAVDRIADVLETIYEIQKQDVRQDVSQNLGDIWRDSTIREYEASLREDFTLSLTKRIGEISEPVVAASTGEKQVLATAFVGALVRKARENMRHAQQSNSGVMPVGGEYPLVMDSPFGALEDKYRAAVSRWLPRLARQVVILASKTQWRDEVERETRPALGKEYVLELHTPKRGADERIRILDREYPYVVETNDVEFTQIREVF